WAAPRASASPCRGCRDRRRRTLSPSPDRVVSRDPAHGAAPHSVPHPLRWPSGFLLSLSSRRGSRSSARSRGGLPASSLFLLLSLQIQLYGNGRNAPSVRSNSILQAEGCGTLLENHLFRR